jgi:hypothetical protein
VKVAQVDTPVMISRKRALPWQRYLGLFRFSSTGEIAFPAGATPFFWLGAGRMGARAVAAAAACGVDLFKAARYAAPAFSSSDIVADSPSGFPLILKRLPVQDASPC